MKNKWMDGKINELNDVQKTEWKYNQKSDIPAF